MADDKVVPPSMWKNKFLQADAAKQNSGTNNNTSKSSITALQNKFGAPQPSKPSSSTSSGKQSLSASTGQQSLNTSSGKVNASWIKTNSNTENVSSASSSKVNFGTRPALGVKPSIGNKPPVVTKDETSEKPSWMKNLKSSSSSNLISANSASKTDCEKPVPDPPWKKNLLKNNEDKIFKRQSSPSLIPASKPVADPPWKKNILKNNEEKSESRAKPNNEGMVVPSQETNQNNKAPWVKSKPSLAADKPVAPNKPTIQQNVNSKITDGKHNISVETSTKTETQKPSWMKPKESIVDCKKSPTPAKRNLKNQTPKSQSSSSVGDLPKTTSSINSQSKPSIAQKPSIDSTVPPNNGEKAFGVKLRPSGNAKQQPQLHDKHTHSSPTHKSGPETTMSQIDNQPKPIAKPRYSGPVEPCTDKSKGWDQNTSTLARVGFKLSDIKNVLEISDIKGGPLGEKVGLKKKASFKTKRPMIVPRVKKAVSKEHSADDRNKMDDVVAEDSEDDEEYEDVLVPAQASEKVDQSEDEGWTDGESSPQAPPRPLQKLKRKSSKQRHSDKASSSRRAGTPKARFRSNPELANRPQSDFDSIDYEDVTFLRKDEQEDHWETDEDDGYEEIPDEVQTTVEKPSIFKKSLPPIPTSAKIKAKIKKAIKSTLSSSKSDSNLNKLGTSHPGKPSRSILHHAATESALSIPKTKSPSDSPKLPPRKAHSPMSTPPPRRPPRKQAISEGEKVPIGAMDVNTSGADISIKEKKKQNAISEVNITDGSNPIRQGHIGPGLEKSKEQRKLSKSMEGLNMTDGQERPPPPLPRRDTGLDVVIPPPSAASITREDGYIEPDNPGPKAPGSVGDRVSSSYLPMDSKQNTMSGTNTLTPAYLSLVADGEKSDTGSGKSTLEPFNFSDMWGNRPESALSSDSYEEMDDEMQMLRSNRFSSRFIDEPLYQVWHSDFNHRQSIEQKLQADIDEDEEENIYDTYDIKDGEIYDDAASFKPSQSFKEEPDEPGTTDYSLETATSAVSPTSPTFKGMRTLWCELPEVIQSGVLDSMAPSQKKIQEAMFEVITSEASYVKSLNLMVNHFFLASELTDRPGCRSCLEKRDKHFLFSNVLAVREVSERFLAALEARWRENIVISDICDIVTKFAENTFDVYIKYCSNQVYQDRTLKKITSDNLMFKEIIDKLEKHKSCLGLSLHSFLILPMQRITRLPLLIDAICHRLEPKTDKHDSAMSALQALNSVVKQCNEGARNMERVEQMVHLDKQLDFDKLKKKIPLISTSRYLVKQGPLQRIVNNSSSIPVFGKKGPSKQQLFLFVFNDIIVITKKKSEERYSVIDYTSRINLHTELVDDDLNTPVPVGCKNLFLLVLLENFENKHVEFLLACESPSERTRWVEALTPAAQENDDEKIYEAWDCPQVQVVHAYTSEQPDELTLEESDIINVTRKMADGWYEGERMRDGEKGWFPSTYTVEIHNAHARARNLRQRYRLLALSRQYLDQH
ncbi:unnamed protein product [Owenia fusiformis]|uniref:Uncharacterized protein n=1 Tax=Owenia fusiformis TaxID=6347 RepID=A0A8J1UBC8_OWEFU|nr:unnamed protein product [Owenia fusiformis]